MKITHFQDTLTIPEINLFRYKCGQLIKQWQETALLFENIPNEGDVYETCAEELQQILDGDNSPIEKWDGNI